MFQISLPKTIMLKMQDDIKNNPDISQIYVASSGNFVAERSLIDLGLPIHSSGVFLYTTILGDYFSGQDRPLSLSEWGKNQYPFLEEYIKTPADKAATALCMSKILQFLTPMGLFCERNLKAYLNEWDEHHAVTKQRLEENEFKLDSYSCCDYAEFLDRIQSENCAVAAFPQNQKQSYQKTFAPFENLFEWESPAYLPYDNKGLESVFTKAKNNTMYLVSDHPLSGGTEIARCVQLRKQPTCLYVNDKKDETRLTTTELKVGTLKHKLFLHGQIPEDAVMSIEILDMGEFNMLRTMYLNKTIMMTNPSVAFGVFINGYLIGGFGINSPPSYMDKVYFDVYPYCYLLSDFPIVCEVRKLAKLIIIAAMSKESLYAIQASFGTRVRWTITTAFTEKDMSMKYRGLMKIRKQTLNSDRGLNKIGEKPDKPTDRCMINYIGKMGEWTLAEGLEQWRDRKKRMA